MTLTYKAGIVLYAHNTKDTDYLKLANLASLLIRKHMPDYPIVLITDTTSAPVVQSYYDKVILCPLPDSNYRKLRTSPSMVRWHNLSRINAFSLSPFEKTLVLDVDYLIFNNELEHIFESNPDIACFYNNVDITNNNAFINDTVIHWTNKIPQYWATGLYFRKNKHTHRLFNLVKHIIDNYEY